ncbi:endonuclease/exonuclease/phosphatase family protein [Nocardioides litoris]|uniref:endonuclease/exonuclease/phosphatase family protein n=1 Tax=Nocardioides litoris TaxID=1926648 RepID=UPI00111D9D79|nr:endonuclease/exonuclease/phosphatase family protein [Nocardioides litoris]
MLRVATANGASGRDSRGTWSVEGWESWCAAAAGLDVDVLAVQEVDHLLPRSGGVDQAAVLDRTLAGSGPRWEHRFAAAVHGTPGRAVDFRSAPATDPAEPSYGVALASRHPVREWRELRLAPSRIKLPLPLPPESGQRVLWVPDEQRVALAAVVEAPDGPVSVVTTHLSFAPTRAPAQLRELVAWAADLPRPLVLLGDLNLPPVLLRTVGPVRAWTTALAEATYPAPEPRVQLDHVLLDGLRATGAGTHRLADSDHLAVRAELERG